MTPELLAALTSLVGIGQARIDEIKESIEDGDVTQAEGNADLKHAQEAVRQVEEYIASGASDPMPVAVVDVSGGTFVDITSNVPMKLIFLDDDIEGGDSENVLKVDGDDVYVTVMTTALENKDSNFVNPDYVYEIGAEISAVVAN